MATMEEVVAFLREQASENTYEDVQREGDSPADCGNYDDAYDMGKSSGKIALAKALVRWIDGGKKPTLVMGFEPDDDAEDDTDDDAEDDTDDETEED